MRITLIIISLFFFCGLSAQDTSNIKHDSISYVNNIRLEKNNTISIYQKHIAKTSLTIKIIKSAVLFLAVFAMLRNKQ